VRLVIVEAGARLTDLALDGAGDADTVVVQQAALERAAELAARVISRLAVIERAGSAVQRAVILVAPGPDAQSIEARHLLARALLTHAHVSKVESAELVLSAGRDADGPLRDQILALVELLVGAPESSSVPIRIQFGSPAEPARQPRRESGVFARSTPNDQTEGKRRGLDPQTSPLESGCRAMASG
jgi:hypothetical protein